jgi:hypothetical protein
MFMADEEKTKPCELYEIKTQGHLDTKWSDWFYGMTICHEGDGTTTLCGSLPDQIVLHSVLDRIQDMNLQLISVNKIVPDARPKNQTKRRNRK